jgi:hypothetical protein
MYISRQISSYLEELERETNHRNKSCPDLYAQTNKKPGADQSPNVSPASRPNISLWRITARFYAPRIDRQILAKPVTNLMDLLF